LGNYEIHKEVHPTPSLIVRHIGQGCKERVEVIEYTLTLPVPPSANKYWIYTGNRVATSPEAKAYKQAVKLLSPVTIITGNVAVNVSVFRPAKRGDLDNYLKVMLDALEGVLYENDNQITEIHAFRYDDKENPRVELVAYEDLDD